MNIFRFGSVELQTQVAARIVEKVSQPNLLLDLNIQWTHSPIFTPRLNTVPTGWQSFRFDDRTTASSLDLPVVTAANGGQHLFVLATGPYAITRGQVALTALREYELKPARARGHTGSLTNYNALASQLPQSTPVLYSHQHVRPTGYSESLHGQWSGPAVVLKCQVPSSHKATIRSNLRTVTFVISTVDVENNPLGLTGPLTRLVSYHCTCLAGTGTNRACAHVLGLCIGLLAPDCFKTVKKKTGRLTDISLPQAHQPSMTGKSFHSKNTDSQQNFNLPIVELKLNSIIGLKQQHPPPTTNFLTSQKFSQLSLKNHKTIFLKNL